MGTENRYVDRNRAPQARAGGHLQGDSSVDSLWVINRVILSRATPSLLGLSAIPSLVTLARTADLNYGPSQVCGSLLGYPPPLPVTDLGAPSPALYLSSQPRLLWLWGDGQGRPSASAWGWGGAVRATSLTPT